MMRPGFNLRISLIEAVVTALTFCSASNRLMASISESQPELAKCQITFNDSEPSSVNLKINRIKGVPSPSFYRIELEQIKSEIEEALAAENDFLSEKGREVSRLAFERVFELMTKHLDENGARQLNDLKSRIFYGLIFETAYYYHTDISIGVDGSQIAISMPQRFRGTLLDYRAQIHELVHGVQHVAVGMLGFHADVESFLEKVRLTAYKEKGAMLWEYAYFQVLPKEFRRSVLRNGSTPKNFKLNVENSMLGSSKNYLRAEHVSGRNSIAHIKSIIVFETYVMPSLKVAFVGTVAGISYFLITY